MNGKQSGFYSMLRRVSDLLKRSLEFITGLPSFTDLQTSFDTNLNEIRVLSELQESDLKGLRKQKETLRATTGKKALNMCRRVLAYATVTGNEVLAGTMYYKEWDLSRLSDNDFVSAVSVIYNSANANKTALTEYGVTAESLTGLKTTIDAFKAIVDTPKEGYTGKKQVTDRLAWLFDFQANNLVKMDVLIDMLKDSQPEFYAEYQDTRKVVYHSGSLMFKLNATDAATGLPLSGVTVNFAQDGAMKLDKVTKEGGGIIYKSMDEGTYDITLSKLGFQTQILKKDIVDGELNAMTVAMVKN